MNSLLGDPQRSSQRRRNNTTRLYRLAGRGRAPNWGHTKEAYGRQQARDAAAIAGPPAAAGAAGG